MSLLMVPGPVILPPSSQRLKAGAGIVIFSPVGISERQRDHVLHRNPRISEYFAIPGAGPVY